MKKTNAVIIALTILIVLAVANFLASRHPLRLDLTESRIYTLSDATKGILKGLDDVVTIRAYFTEDLPPAMQPLRRDVDDILSEFKGAARNRLQVEFVDPSSSKMDEQKAMMLGIPPVQLNVVEKDKQEVAKIYLGMAVMFGDKQQVLPVVKDLDNLEYELAEAIIKVSSKELPKVLWRATTRGEEQRGDGYTLIREAISRRYDIVEVTDKNLGEIDPKKNPAMVLISPGKLSDEELSMLDKHLTGGGKLIALVDRFEIGPQLGIKAIETNVPDLLMGYGVTVEDMIVLDQSNAMASFSGGAVTYHIPYPYWPEARRGQFNPKEPIVSGLESAVFPWTSPLILAPKGEGNGMEAALIKSSKFATTVSAKDAKLDPQSAGEALIGGKHEERPLVAMESGPGDAGSRIFVVGSSRWLTDRVLQTFPQNAALFQNALDSFAMGDMLIGIRSRGNVSHPIVVLSDGARAALKYANIVLGPLAVVVIGLILLAVRRSRRRSAQLMYKN